MIKVLSLMYVPLIVIHFSHFRAICEYRASKNLPLLLRTIFSHLRTNQSAAEQVRDPTMQTSGNRKEPSLVSKSHGVELLR